MFGSLKLGKLFGIDTYVHGTFWLLPLFVFLQNFSYGLDAILFQLLFVFAVFGCVALHEVGHALAAAAYGIRTRDITLYPIGGVASLERMPDKPLQEVAVALAGPAVNVVIAIGLLAGLVISGIGFVLPTIRQPDIVGEFVSQLVIANVVLCLFNLLPSFPMDGGRVLRALLSIRMTRVRATEVAVKVGAVVAALLVILGVVSQTFSLIFIAIVVWMLGQAELAGVRVAETRKEWDRRAREWFGGAPTPAPAAPPLPADPDADLAARRFSGLAWDTKRRVWVQWFNGVPVRDVPA
jgi:Zn-dependent protease